MAENMTVQEAADHFQVSVPTIEHWVRQGKLVAQRVGGTIQVSLADVTCESPRGAGDQCDTPLEQLCGSLTTIEIERDLAIPQMGEPVAGGHRESRWRQVPFSLLSGVFMLALAAGALWVLQEMRRSEDQLENARQNATRSRQAMMDTRADLEEARRRIRALEVRRESEREEMQARLDKMSAAADEQLRQARVRAAENRERILNLKERLVQAKVAEERRPEMPDRIGYILSEMAGVQRGHLASGGAPDKPDGE